MSEPRQSPSPKIPDETMSWASITMKVNGSSVSSSSGSDESSESSTSMISPETGCTSYSTYSTSTCSGMRNVTAGNTKAKTAKVQIAEPAFSSMVENRVE